MTKIALAQTTTGDEFGTNLEAADRMAQEAAENGAALPAFPEVFLYPAGYKGKLKVAEPLDGAIVSRFREAAARHGMMLLLGSIHERIPDDASRVYNTSVLIGANGEVLASYRKLKLFDVALPTMKIEESDSIAPGDAVPPVVDTSIGKLGLTICFDLRFSDLYLDLRRRGAEIVFIPSNFTAPTGAEPRRERLRAKAARITMVAAIQRLRIPSRISLAAKHKRIFTAASRCRRNAHRPHPNWAARYPHP